jgi:ribosomal protein S18 acetylase RimI-like enzyme
MRLDLTQRAGSDHPNLETVDRSHTASLASLMLAAYRGTADDEGEGLDDAIAEVARTIDGAYGPLVPGASFVVADEDRAVGAILVTLWEDRPLIAHVIVGPSRKRTGLGTELMLAASNALAASGHEELDLFVTEANEPAVRFYRKLGFRTVERMLAPPDQHPS